MKISIRLTRREAWQTLKAAIPDGASKLVAKRYGVNPDHVRRWRREPLSDEAPLASGQRSPLDRVCDLMDAIFLSHQRGAALLVEHVRDHYESLLEPSVQTGEEWDRRAHAAKTLREAAEAVNCLNLDTPDEETINELLDVSVAISEAIKQLQSRRRAAIARQVTTEPAADGGIRAGSGGGRA